MLKRQIMIENQADFVVLQVQNSAAKRITDLAKRCSAKLATAKSALNGIPVAEDALRNQMGLQTEALTKPSPGKPQT